LKEYRLKNRALGNTTKLMDEITDDQEEPTHTELVLPDQ